jgi:hypothetical protein
MALIKCPRCGAPVSDAALQCFRCSAALGPGAPESATSTGAPSSAALGERNFDSLASEPPSGNDRGRVRQWLADYARLLGEPGRVAEFEAVLNRVGAPPGPSRARVVGCFSALVFGFVTIWALVYKAELHMDMPIGRDAQVLPGYQRTELLYLRAEPCSHLYVEVDAVEGAAPGEPALEALEAFLKAECRKEQIVIHPKRPIARAEVKGLSPARIALEHIEGPVDMPAEGTAYLYVLCYDSTLYGGSSKIPHVRADSPTAIWVDMAYLRKAGSRAEDLLPRALVHEAGHVLGLKRGEGGAHCLDQKCVMYAFSGQQRRALCAACEQDLAAAREGPGDARLSFSGPLLIRREKEYAVAKLPAMTGVAFGSDASLDWRAVARLAREELVRAPSNPGEGLHGMVSMYDPARLGPGPAVDAVSDLDPDVVEEGAYVLRRFLHREDGAEATTPTAREAERPR